MNETHSPSLFPTQIPNAHKTKNELLLLSAWILLCVLKHVRVCMYKRALATCLYFLITSWCEQLEADQVCGVSMSRSMKEKLALA